MKKYMILFVLMTLLLTSCSVKTAIHEKMEETPDVTQFYKENPCGRLKIVVEYGYDKVDQGHYLLLIPSWMKSNIRENITKSEVVACAVGLYDSYTGEPVDPLRAEYIEALLFFMIELNYQKEPEISEIFYCAICEDSLFDNSLLINTYYYDLNKRFPDEKMTPQEAITQICSMKSGDF